MDARHRRSTGGIIMLAFLAALSFAPPAYADGYVPIAGSGSTWSQNALDQWRKNVASQYGMTVNYSGTGSSAGRQDFINQTVDFAISEIPFQSQPEDGSAPEVPPVSYAYLPAVAGGTSLAYNLKIGGTRVTDLRLSGETIAKIFSGGITNWSDAAIRADNPSLAMPDKAITPVYRSDGSGTSAQFTLWMAKQFPSVWTYGMRSQFPGVNSTFKGQNGSLGVAGYVSAPYGEGAITYVESSYALKTGLPVAKVLNHSGYYIAPTPQSVAVALMGATVHDDFTQNLEGVYDSADPRAYPISSYSYMIVPTQDTRVFNADKGKTLSKFASYMVCEGQQQAAALGYSPLPMNLVQAASDVIKTIPGSTGGIDLDRCGNPNFRPGDSPSDNVLTSTAPMPAESDRAGVDASEHLGVGLTATVSASDRFELHSLVSSPIDLGIARPGGTSIPVPLGRLTVVDTRASGPGWDLVIAVSDFAQSSNSDVRFSASALGLSPSSIDVPPGVRLGLVQEAGIASYPTRLAGGEPGSGTGESGFGVDALLTFKSPSDAALGVYASVLTITLVSR